MNVELSRRERKKDETRHRIFHAAIDLFRERGFEQTTVDDITEKADVAKGTFFNYFHRKDAVLAYLSESRLLAIEENAGTFLSTDRPATEKLIEIYTVGASAYEEDHELARYVLIELMSRVFEPSEESMMRWHRLIMSIIRQGQERGELQPDADPERVESVLSCIYHGTLYQWVCRLPDVFVLLPELRARLVLAMEGFTR
jgi:AcrR family transcriptional regulator